MMVKVVPLLLASGAYACQSEAKTRRHDRHLQRQDGRDVFPPPLTKNERTLVDSFNDNSLSAWSFYYTHGRALAGENDKVAQWTADKWTEYGFNSRLDGYYIDINYPVHQSVQLRYANGSTYSPTLQEDVLDEDETTGYPDRIPIFHGYSYSGNASAEYIYVGRGQQVDFERLEALGVQLEGKIALAKYGGPFRGLKVKNAQEHGMIGVITFTDPGDDGIMTEANGYLAYPHGPARNPTSIQRGSVLFLSTYPGDPTTPGYPSKPDSPRQEKKTVPEIPSLPISWLEAKPLLQSLNGHGVVADVVNRTKWIGAIPDVAYSTGPVPGATIDMSNIAEDKKAWIWNTIGIINGTEQDEVVVVGNHHDAWMIGGAADPHAGSAILIELAKAFSNLLATGWKPKRTIVLASWDAEEYGLVGSTEWVEEFIPWLKDAAVSYLNTDVAVSGTIPDFAATPDLHNITLSIAKKIVWPLSDNNTIYDIWKEKSGEIEALGAQSDYTAFVHRGGIASIDLGTTRAPTDPIYHTHSNYDSYHWMTNFCDPGFRIHKAIGQYLSLLLYHMVDDDILPLEPAGYSTELRAYFEELQSIVTAPNGSLALDLTSLEGAITTFEEAGKQFTNIRQAIADGKQFHNPNILKVVNRKTRNFSRGFISEGGLPGREFFRNLIFAPGVDTGYAPVTFPGITEAVNSGDLELAKEFVEKTAKAVMAAASGLLIRPFPKSEMEAEL